MDEDEPPDIRKKIKKYFSLIKYVSKAITNDLGYSSRGRLNDLIQTSQILLMAKREISRIKEKYCNWHLVHCEEEIKKQDKLIDSLMGAQKFCIERGLVNSLNLSSFIYL